jgi:NADH-quinone oxidoreductase subunit C
MTGLVDALAAGVGDDLVAVEPGFGPTTLDVRAGAWVAALRALCGAGASFFDFLTAYDERDAGFAVVAHLSTPDAAEHVLLRARVPRCAPAIVSAVPVYRGAAWHERETHEMFGIDFPGHPGLTPLLLPEGFGAAPLRKDFVLAARAARPWPGLVEPVRPGGPARRPPPTPGVPQEWAQVQGPVPGADPGAQEHSR